MVLLSLYRIRPLQQLILNRYAGTAIRSFSNKSNHSLLTNNTIIQRYLTTNNNQSKQQQQQYQSQSQPEPAAEPEIVTVNSISSRPLTWSELSYWINHRRLDRLGRSAAIAADYQKHRRTVLQQWTSMDDYIRHRYLGWEIKQQPIESHTHWQLLSQSTDPTDTALNAATGTGESINNNSNNNPNNHHKLVSEQLTTIAANNLHTPVLSLNEYPYYTTTDIIHWLLWSNIELSLLNCNTAAIQYFPINLYQSLVFINEPEQKSIKNVFHSHIFVRQIPIL